MVSKRMKTALGFLGSKYTVQKIDWENCIYRDLGNGFDIEVSGINSPPEGLICRYVYVWDIRNGKNSGALVVERVRNIKTLDELKLVLDRLEERFKAC